MKFKLSNFNAQNTPVLIRAIGNWCLLIGAIGGAILLYHVQNPDAFFPPFLITVISWATTIGTVGKFLSMFAGVTSVEELTKLVNQTNKHLDQTSDDAVPMAPLVIRPATPVTPGTSV